METLNLPGEQSLLPFYFPWQQAWRPGSYWLTYTKALGRISAPQPWSSGPLWPPPPHPPWPCHHHWAFTLFLIWTLVRRTEVPSWIELKPAQTPLPWDWAISLTPLLVCQTLPGPTALPPSGGTESTLPRLCGGVWCLCCCSSLRRAGWLLPKTGLSPSLTHPSDGYLRFH